MGGAYKLNQPRFHKVWESLTRPSPEILKALEKLKEKHKYPSTAHKEAVHDYIKSLFVKADAGYTNFTRLVGLEVKVVNNITDFFIDNG